MRPVRLNLLSPDKRAYLERLMYLQFGKGLAESVLLVLCFAGILLLGGNWVLQNHFNSLAASLASISNQQTARNRQIKNINRILIQTDQLQKNYYPWHKTLVKLANSVPARVSLTSLEANQANKLFTIAGTAQTRDDLLQLQKNLTAIPGFKSVTIPISQLTSKENLAFSITAAME